MIRDCKIIASRQVLATKRDLFSTKIMQYFCATRIPRSHPITPKFKMRKQKHCENPTLAKELVDSFEAERTEDDRVPAVDWTPAFTWRCEGFRHYGNRFCIGSRPFCVTCIVICSPRATEAIKIIIPRSAFISELRDQTEKQRATKSMALNPAPERFASVV